MKNLFRLKFMKTIAVLMAVILLIPTSVYVAAEEQEPEIIYGDVNGDLAVNAADALAVLKHAAKLEMIPDALLNAADVYKDAAIDASDAIMILKYAARLFDKLPIENTKPTPTPKATSVPLPDTTPVLKPTKDPAEDSQYSADITLIDGTATITVYTKAFSNISVGVISDKRCIRIKLTDEFSEIVSTNEEYVYAGIGDRSAIDANGYVYSVYSGSGLTSDGSPIPYEGAIIQFIYEDVEEGTEFSVVYDIASCDRVTDFPVLAVLTAVDKGIEPTSTPTVEPPIPVTPGPDDTPVPTVPAETATPEPDYTPTPTPTCMYPTDTPTPLPTATPTLEPTVTPTPEPTVDPRLKPITYDAETDTYTMHGQHDWPEATDDQNRYKSNAEYQIANPFVGMDFSEEYTKDAEGMPVWTKGATISFWVYLPEGNVDAEVLTFKLGNYRQCHKDDYVKYLTCQAYTPEDETYAMGTSETYVSFTEDGTETEYTVLSGYGSNVRYNPEYPAEGLYKVNDEKGTIDVIKKGADPTVEANWTKISNIGTGYYEGYSKRFEEEDGEKSKIREANINGSLNIYASGSIVWQQDDQNSIQINPNADKYNEVCPMFNPSFFYHANGINLSWQLDQILKETSAIPPVIEKKGEWHFMVVSIMNDWVQVYQDGVKLEQNKYINMNGAWLNPSVLRKSLKEFNLGYGYRNLWNTNSPNLPNSLGMLLTDYISYDTTELYVGGYGVAANRAGMVHIGTPDGTQVKNIQFYAEPVKDEDVKADKVENLTPIAK